MLGDPHILVKHNTDIIELITRFSFILFSKDVILMLSHFLNVCSIIFIFYVTWFEETLALKVV
jgi:hypothetical protein